jgi:hypothetical protein
MAKKTSRKKSAAKPRERSDEASNKKSPAVRSKSADQALRDHLLSLLKGGGAHATFEDTLGGWPLQFAGVKVAKFPHTAWMLLEHLRIAQLDILEFSRNSKHVSPKWPEGYWPESPAPPNEYAWKASMESCKRDLQAMQRLVGDQNINLFAKIPWGEGQTVLREALILADHNAYHLGQLMMLRKSLGV